jgi:hypothetical protein
MPNDPAQLAQEQACIIRFGDTWRGADQAGRCERVNQSYTKRQSDHVKAVKSLPCSVCDAPSPSAAHHIRQDQPYLCVALCQDCHQGANNGWHGRKAIWRVKKMDEYDALAITIQRILC